MKSFFKLLRFFSTELGKKVKSALIDLLEIVTDKMPNKPQLKNFGKKYGKEGLFYGLTIGEDELEKLINNSNWDNERKETFKKRYSHLKLFLKHESSIAQRIDQQNSTDFVKQKS